MITRWAVKLAQMTTENSDKEDIDEDVYRYAYEIFIGKLITYSALLFIGSCFQITSELAVFILFFMLLRSHTGGYHMESYARCIISTIIMSVLAVVFAKLMNRDALSIVISLTLASGTLICFCSPVNHPNLALNDYEIKSLKKRSFFILAVEYAIIFFLYQNERSMAISACLAIICVAISIVLAKAKKQEAF